MTDIKLLPLPLKQALDLHIPSGVRFYGHSNESMQHYARANVAHATAAKDAEIEALRAEVERLTFEMGCLQQQYDERTSYVIVHRGAALACSESAHAAYTDEHHRAERLEEALRELQDLMLGQVKWTPCDCGCPQQRTPDGPHSVTWLRAAQQVEIAISKAEGKE